MNSNEIDELKRKIKIKDEYIKLLIDILYDYDGEYDKEEQKGSITGLAELIDMACDYLNLALESNDKEAIYTNFKDAKLNILFEEVNYEK